MASTYNIGMSCEIVIDSTNDTIDFTDSGSAASQAELTNQTYADIEALCTEIGTQMTAAATAADTYTASLVWDATYKCGKVKIENDNGNFTLVFAGAGNSTARTIIGGAASNKTGADNYTMNYQHMYGWYSDHGPFMDSDDRPLVGGGSPFRTRTGLVRRVVNPNTLHERELEFQLIQKEKAMAKHATSNYLNQDFETFWEQVAGGTSFTLFSDEDFTDEGTYYLMQPVDKLTDDVFKRHSQAVERYGIKLLLSKDES